LAVAEHGCVGSVCNTVWCVVQHLYDLGGIGIFSFMFLWYAFHTLVWKVWSASMKRRDEEIQRVIEERNFFQSRLFSERKRPDSWHSD
jgi:hypothetical protein